ncbi:uncharacterized, partial [Tachysurus ichikawai]
DVGERSGDEVSSCTKGNSPDRYRSVSTQLACWLSPAASSGDIGIPYSVNLVYFLLRGRDFARLHREGLLLHSGTRGTEQSEESDHTITQRVEDAKPKQHEISHRNNSLEDSFSLRPSLSIRVKR